MCAKFEYRNLSRYYFTNSATPPYISTNGTVNTRLLIDKIKIANISLKIFKTLFFKIYNPTFNKVHIPDKTLFSKYLPPQT